MIVLIVEQGLANFMSMYRKTPIYNLKAVLNQTNLKADVLRAWERRYGLPTPQRTQGGHRLYSDYDIEVINWLKTWLDNGLSISSAVELWKEINALGRDPLESLPQESRPEPKALSDSSPQLEEISRKWLTACMAFDTSASESILDQAFAQYSVETVCIDIIQRGIHEAGNMWFQGKITVQQEHFATGNAIRRIHALISASPEAIRSETILIGCPQGEWHTLPGLLLTLLLRRKGFNVINLGANVPLDQLVETAAAINPVLIILAAQQLQSAASLYTAASLLRKAHKPVAFGGLIFNRIPGLKDQIPAVFLGNHIFESVKVVEQFISSSQPVPDSAEISPAFQKAAASFRTKAFLVGIRVLNKLQEINVSGQILFEVNTYFGDRIQAGLDLGDLSYIEPDFEWVEQLLSEHHFPAEYLNYYLSIYRQVVRDELKESGEIIENWISEYIINKRKLNNKNLE